MECPFCETVSSNAKGLRCPQSACSKLRARHRCHPGIHVNTCQIACRFPCTKGFCPPSITECGSNCMRKRPPQTRFFCGRCSDCVKKPLNNSDLLQPVKPFVVQSTFPTRETSSLANQTDCLPDCLKPTKPFSTISDKSNNCRTGIYANSYSYTDQCKHYCQSYSTSKITHAPSSVLVYNLGHMSTNNSNVNSVSNRVSTLSASSVSSKNRNFRFKNKLNDVGSILSHDSKIFSNSVIGHKYSRMTANGSLIGSLVRTQSSQNKCKELIDKYDTHTYSRTQSKCLYSNKNTLAGPYDFKPFSSAFTENRKTLANAKASLHQEYRQHNHLYPRCCNNNELTEEQIVGRFPTDFNRMKSYFQCSVPVSSKVAQNLDYSMRHAPNYLHYPNQGVMSGLDNYYFSRASVPNCGEQANEDAQTKDEDHCQNRREEQNSINQIKQKHLYHSKNDQKQLPTTNNLLISQHSNNNINDDLINHEDQNEALSLEIDDHSLLYGRPTGLEDKTINEDEYKEEFIEESMSPSVCESEESLNASTLHLGDPKIIIEKIKVKKLIKPQHELKDLDLDRCSFNISPDSNYEAPILVFPHSGNIISPSDHKSLQNEEVSYFKPSNLSLDDSRSFIQSFDGEIDPSLYLDEPISDYENKDEVYSPSLKRSKISELDPAFEYSSTESSIDFNMTPCLRRGLNQRLELNKGENMKHPISNIVKNFPVLSSRKDVELNMTELHNISHVTK